MQKKIFSFVISLTFILSCITPFRAFAAAEEVLAAFEYTSEGTELTDGDKSSGYDATSGIMQASAKLFASVDGTNPRKLEWSKAEYSYKDSTAAMVPVMSAGSKNLWGSNPYFEVKCSTLGYENIKFSAKVNGSNKGPANYKLQYSTDHKNYADIISAPQITQNKVLQNNLFDNVPVNDASDKATVYFRIIASDTVTIGGKSLTNDPTGGEAAINDIIISGTSKSAAILTLAAPVSSVENNSEIYGNTEISLSCSTSKTAQIQYTVNDGAVTEYTGAFMPFKNISDSKVIVKTWAMQDEYTVSDTAVYTYTSTKDEITSFDFSDGKYPDYVNGAIEADSGIYPTGRITASLDGKTKYAPIYSSKEKAISISPDDTYTWHEGGYWQIETSTAGYKNIYLSADAFSSKKGPARMMLQYSTDGNSYETLYADKLLPVSDTGTYYSDYKLPDAAADKQNIYIRFVIRKDERADSTDSAPLFDNESKGNTYINKIVISGDRTDSLKMPYTTKATTYFGANGSIAYKSFDDAVIKYSIYTKNGIPITENREYNSSEKISLAALPSFDAQLCNQFRVDVWAENGTQKSMTNSQTYTYKGDTVAAFEYKKSNGSSVTAQKSVASTDGNATLSMYPNGADAAEISYNSATKALRVEASDTNAWNFDTAGKAPDNDGYWLITASTKGYKDIKFSAEQSSTSKGPRDYSVSFSTDGVNYTPLGNSSIRVTDSLNPTYSNISLPSELNDKDKIYIKIKIDGGETLSGLELSSTDPTENVYGNGNTDINNIELCGTKIENKLGIDGNPQTIEKGKAYYINYTSAAANPALILAGYNSKGEMIICNLYADKIEIPSDSEVTDIKVMLWENLNSLVPIAPAVTKEVK